jgi:predicted ArsR family transcriptional regulator
MQATRRRILEILKEQGQATVDELSEKLNLTAVTVRHHLDVLRSEELVDPPVVRHRSTPGRPQYVYALTPRAAEYFPKNFDGLSNRLLDSMRCALDERQINVIFEGVTQRFVAEAPPAGPTETLEQSLDRITAFLDRHGYVARWEKVPEGYVLHTSNCPYEGTAADYPELCAMDFSMMAALLGQRPERMGRLVEGCGSCSYLIRAPQVASTVWSGPAAATAGQ